MFFLLSVHCLGPSVLSTDGIWGGSLCMVFPRHVMVPESQSLAVLNLQSWNQCLVTSAVTEAYLPTVDSLYSRLGSGTCHLCHLAYTSERHCDSICSMRNGDIKVENLELIHIRINWVGIFSESSTHNGSTGKGGD